VLRDGRPVVSELTLRQKAGHQVTLRVRSVPIRYRDGAIIGAAESFDEDRRSEFSERPHNKLSNYGCLDEATGVLTRSYIGTHLRESLTTFAEHRIPFSILCGEVAGMANFRATHGALAVAPILRVAAQTIEASIQPTDFLGHGAENKCLTILAECSPPEIGRVAERLLRMVHNSKVKWRGDNLSLAASFGQTSARDGDTERTIMERAEKSLVESIHAGRDRVTISA
jgi:diguanylate cyclase (GGDEF)-like protein